MNFLHIKEGYDVIVIGGGITGAGTARDCALRGLSTLLVERFDIATGAKGRNHGLLHSGARYAVKDPESAQECIRENIILKKIAAHCIEPTGGVFISLPEDGLDYQKLFIDSCLSAGIEAEALDTKELLLAEPALNPSIIGAVSVPDGSVDPFRLAQANVTDALLHGADLLVNTAVKSIIVSNGRANGVELYDRSSGCVRRVEGRYIINAAGIWGETIAKMAGMTVRMFPAKGSLLVYGHRITGKVVNRCRKPSDGDILVPGDTVSILGTTSTRVPFDAVDSVRPTAEEVDALIAQGSALVPSLESERVIRAYSGVRPLVSADDDPDGRNISRGIVLLDHLKRDGLDGFITITGGKLMTYRLMAKKVTDLVCSKMSLERACMTDSLPLPGSESTPKIESGYSASRKAASLRQGNCVSKIEFRQDDEEICECEHVSVAEIRYAVEQYGVTSLEELRRRTRLGMGTCQGAYCMGKAAKALAEALGTPDKEDEILSAYLRERWLGMKAAGWGDTLREAEFMRRKYIR